MQSPHQLKAHLRPADEAAYSVTEHEQTPTARPGATVLGTFVDALDWQQTLKRISGWAAQRESRCVCCCNVHSVITATRNPKFQEVIAAADMATVDGAPIAWMLRRLGFPEQERINGPDLMWKYCEATATLGGSIFLYGSSVETLSALQGRLMAAFPGLVIAGTFSPPYRSLTPEEDARIIDAINASGASMVFVSLGCPKQELWMAEHRGLIRAVMIGVGAAFDYHGGTLTRAPAWIRNAGFEWIYRLGAEPRRLWKRYLITNSLFLLGAARQLTGRSDCSAKVRGVQK